MSAPKHRKAQPREILAEQVTALHAQGLNALRIAERLRISKTYAYELIDDPTGARARERKQRLCGTCVECGGPTSYDVGGPPERCRDCWDGRYVERNERIFEAWQRGETGVEIGRREGMTADTVQSLVNHYRLRYGMPLDLHRVPNRTHWLHIQRRWNEDGATLQEIADELGYQSPANVSQQITTMRRKGWHIESRTPRHDPAIRARAIRMVRGGRSAYSVARELGLPQSTVWKWAHAVRDEAVAA